MKYFNMGYKSTVAFSTCNSSYFSYESKQLCRLCYSSNSGEQVENAQIYTHYSMNRSIVLNAPVIAHPSVRKQITSTVPLRYFDFCCGYLFVYMEKTLFCYLEPIGRGWGTEQVLT